MTPLRFVLPFAAALIASPALADPPADHDRHHPPAGAKADASHDHAGHKSRAHDHAAKPSAAEMEKMHKHCEEMMAKAAKQ